LGYTWSTIILALWVTAAPAPTIHDAVMVRLLLSASGQEVPDAEAVERQWRRVTATFEEGDADAFMALTTDDVVLMPPGASTLSNRDAVRSLMREYFAAYTIELEELSLEEIVVAGDWAFVRDTYVSNLTPRSGGTAVRAKGKNVWVLRCQADGSWKVARNMWNSSDPDSDS